MEEERKSLVETVSDLNKKIDDLTGKKKEKKKMNIPIVGWVYGLVLGGLFFTLGWLFIKDIITGVIIGIVTMAVTLFISARMNNQVGWNLPWKSRFLGRRKKRKGYCVFMNIGTNRAITFVKAPIEEGVAMVNDAPHVVSPEDILLWKNKIPIVITYQNALTPVRCEELQRKAEATGTTTKGWQYVMNYIYKTQIKDKKNVPTFLIIIGIIAVIGLGYYLIKSGAFK